RTSGRAQARPGDSRIRSKVALDRFDNSICRTRPSNRGAIRGHRSPSQHRKSAESCGKSRRDDEFVGAEPSSAAFEALTTRYEQLRAFVLGTGGDANGLVVLLRGGIVAWLQAQASIPHALK